MDSLTGEWPALFKMLAAMVFVLGLMGGLYVILRKLGFSGHIQQVGHKSRLKIVESIPVDPRRRLALVQRDDVQHLVIFGPNGETVIETDIKPKDNKSS